MCFPVDSAISRVKFVFKPTKTTVPIQVPEVRAFEISGDPTQPDADAAAAALEDFYTTLPEGQQAIIAQLVLQAAEAAG